MQSKIAPKETPTLKLGQTPVMTVQAAESTRNSLHRDTSEVGSTLLAAASSSGQKCEGTVCIGLAIPLRWHGSLSANVNKNANLE